MMEINRPVFSKLIYIMITASIFVGCGRERSNVSKWTPEDSTQIVKEILAHRSRVDSSFRSDPQSPFVRDTSIRFTGIKWFLPNLNYYLTSKLSKHEKPETVQIYGTKGDASRYIKYGYFTFELDGDSYKLNAYKFTADDSRRSSIYKKYLSVWFTDETTGKETYPVGRYIDVGEEYDDPNHLYTLNFNNAYNPYCAYSSLYSCAIPRKEDHLAVAVKAGEIKNHN